LDPTIHPHRNTRLTPHSRLALVCAYQTGVSMRLLAAQYRISVVTAYRYWHRYQAEGTSGLCNRSSRPNVIHRRLSDEQRQLLLQRRRETWWGPRRLAYEIPAAPATLYRACAMAGLNRHRRERPPCLRYEAAAPGALVHLDVLHLTQGKGLGRQYQFTVVDDHTRETWACLTATRTTAVALRVLKQAQQRLGYRFQAVLTDNDAAFTLAELPQLWGSAHAAPVSRFTKGCTALGIAHKRTRVRHPQTNGKVERFHRTIREECWRPLLAQVEAALAAEPPRSKTALRQRWNELAQQTPWQEVLETYLTHYNTNRRHTGIGGQTPQQRRIAYFATPQELPTS